MSIEAHDPGAGEGRHEDEGEAGRAGGRAAAYGYLRVPGTDAAVQRIYDADVAEVGYVMNLSRLWAQLPEAKEALFGLIGGAVAAAGITFRQRGILVAACVATVEDSYCSLAWGSKLAAEAGPDLAASVLRGEDGPPDPAERALADWARQVAGDPSRTAAADLRPLREAGFDDRQIFAVTLFVALRLAFATVNDALGVLPDAVLGETAPEEVRRAVGYGRPVADRGTI